MNQRDIYQDLYRTCFGVKNCWTVETLDGRFIHFFESTMALAFYLTGNINLEKNGVPHED